MTKMERMTLKKIKKESQK